MREFEAQHVVASELGADVSSTERAIQLARIIGSMEKVRLDRKQRLGTATIGGAMQAFDSAFDKYDINTARANGNEILELVEGRSNETPHLDARLRRALEIARDNFAPAALNTLAELTRAQIHSLKQREPGLSRDEARDITRQKGGKSALLFALEVNPDMSRAKQACYEELGYLMQLMDDFSDREIDTRDGLTTLANSVSEPDLLKEIRNQNIRARKLFERQYEAYQLTELFQYIDKLLAASGILG